MFKKNNIVKFIAVFCLTILFSCEKVVKINVKSDTNAIVVQANLSNESGPYKVKLESSASYYDSNVFPPVTGAKVTITDNTGQSEILSENAQGIYLTNTLKGIVGSTYDLKIETNGKTYVAKETMPKPLPIDSFIIVPRIGRNSLQPNGYSVVCKFTDPVGVGNFYRIVINSRDSSALGGRTSRIISDKLADGAQLAATFRTQLLFNDTLTIQLQSIPKSTYDFFNTISSAQGDVGAGQFLSSLPANPTSNISNKGFGYFSVYAVTSLTAVVK